MPASAVTGEATDITQTSAVLHGTVSAGAEAGEVYFFYGLDDQTGVGPGSPNFEEFVAVAFVEAGEEDVPVQATVAELEPGTVYHFLAVFIGEEAAGPLDWVRGEDRTFATEAEEEGEEEEESAAPAAPVPTRGLYLDIDLTDREQNVLTRLDRRRSGTRVELGLNAGRRAFVPLALDDDAREVVEAVDTLLRVTLRGPDDFSLPLFIGRVLIPEQASQDARAQLGINAADAMFDLDRALIRWPNGSVWGPAIYSADQSSIMWTLIETAAALGVEHGIVKGEIPESLSRDRTYPPTKEIGPALVELSEVIGGPDFELEPVLSADGGSATIARFNTFYPRQGEDRSESVRFVYGAFPHTAVGVTFSPGGEEIANRVVAIGAPREQEGAALPFSEHPGYVAEHEESIERYGALEKRLPLEDVTETPTLESHAKGAVAAAAFPVPYFDVTNAPEQAGDAPVGSEGVPPRFGIDYWIGDTIAVDYFADGPDSDPIDLVGRITDAVVTERDSGQLEVKLTCAPEVDAEGVSGEAITLLVPEGSEE